MTERQQRFVDEYLIDGNATQAAIRAGYSERTAAQIGAENLRKPDIAAAIAIAKADRSARLRISADWVLEQQQALVASALTRDTDGSVEIARKALRDIGDGIGMYVDRVEHTGKDGGPIQLSEAERKAKVLSLLERAKGRKAA